MTPPDRQKLAHVIAAMSELTGEADARLARIVDVARTNMTAFVAGRRINAISLESALQLLRRYGFVWADGLIEPALAETCPVLRLMRVSDADAAVIQRMFEIFVHQGYLVSLRSAPALRDDEFVLTIKGRSRTWCAVALFEEPERSELLELIQGLDVIRQSPLRLDESTLQVWRECGPRRHEVLALS